MTNNMLPIVKLAIELEEKGYEFYTQTAHKSQNPLAISTLNSLAVRELEHIKRIKEFYMSLTGEKQLKHDWLAKVSVPPTKAQLLKPILDNLKKSLGHKFETEADINNAYKIAEGLEKDSFKLYDGIAKQAPDDTTKKFFTALAEEENEHYAILDETLEYLNNPGDWFKRQERWIVEG